MKSEVDEILEFCELGEDRKVDIMSGYFYLTISVRHRYLYIRCYGDHNLAILVTTDVARKLLTEVVRLSIIFWHAVDIKEISKDGSCYIVDKKWCVERSLTQEEFDDDIMPLETYSMHRHKFNPIKKYFDQTFTRMFSDSYKGYNVIHELYCGSYSRVYLAKKNNVRYIIKRMLPYSEWKNDLKLLQDVNGRENFVQLVDYYIDVGVSPPELHIVQEMLLSDGIKVNVEQINDILSVALQKLYDDKRIVMNDVRYMFRDSTPVIYDYGSYKYSATDAELKRALAPLQKISKS